MNRIVIIGAGGHARVLMEAIAAADSSAQICGVLDSDQTSWGTSVHGVDVLGGDDLLETLAREGSCDSFVIAIGGINSFQLRRSLFERAIGTGLTACTIRHPTAVCSRSAETADGCQLLIRSVINAGAVLSENVIVNTAAIVEHDCFVGAHAHIAPQACLAGGVNVGPETHIGTGAVVKENLTIGRRVIVGAGAVVVSDVPDNTVVVGVPARRIRDQKS